MLKATQLIFLAFFVLQTVSMIPQSDNPLKKVTRDPGHRIAVAKRKLHWLCALTSWLPASWRPSYCRNSGKVDIESLYTLQPSNIREDIDNVLGKLKELVKFLQQDPESPDFSLKKIEGMQKLTDIVEQLEKLIKDTENLEESKKVRNEAILLLDTINDDILRLKKTNPAKKKKLHNC